MPRCSLTFSHTAAAASELCNNRGRGLRNNDPTLLVIVGVQDLLPMTLWSCTEVVRLSVFTSCSLFGANAKKFRSPADRLCGKRPDPLAVAISPPALLPRVCILISPPPCRSYTSILQSSRTTCPYVASQCVSPGHYFEFPNPCNWTLHVRSILICAENCFDSVFASCWYLHCFPTNSSIPFITEAKHIPRAARWIVRGPAGLCKTRAFLLQNKFSFIILDSYLLDLSDQRAPT